MARATSHLPSGLNSYRYKSAKKLKLKYNQYLFVFVTSCPRMSRETITVTARQYNKYDNDSVLKVKPLSRSLRTREEHWDVKQPSNEKSENTSVEKACPWTVLSCEVL